MAPRKQKNQEPTVQETPVILFLKVPETKNEEVVPFGETNRQYTYIAESTETTNPSGTTKTYSEILHSVESSKVGQRFGNDLLKPMLDKISRDSCYSEHTACFWCCHTFESQSFVLPISFDAYQNVYSCEGNFCSPECALASLYADASISDSSRWNRHAMLNYLYSELYKDGKELSPAPPRSLLRLFGGHLDIDQYREYVSSTNDLIMSELPPIRVVFPSMNVQGPLRDVKKYVSLSNDIVEKASESLRLKRSKPVHVNVPTLDMCILGSK
jgi:hypothetical protein